MSEFEKTLELYKKNVVEYKVSGNAAYKVASDTAKKWLDDYLKSMEDKANTNKKEIEEFVKNYDKNDEELASLKKDMREIREQGPELQIMYETEKEADVEGGLEVDYTTYYSKGAVLLGVIGLIAVSSFI